MKRRQEKISWLKTRLQKKPSIHPPSCQPPSSHFRNKSNQEGALPISVSPGAAEPGGCWDEGCLGGGVGVGDPPVPPVPKSEGVRDIRNNAKKSESDKGGKTRKPKMSEPANKNFKIPFDKTKYKKITDMFKPIDIPTDKVPITEVTDFIETKVDQITISTREICTPARMTPETTVSSDQKPALDPTTLSECQPSWQRDMLEEFHHNLPDLSQQEFHRLNQRLTGSPLGQNNNLFSLSKLDKLGTGQDEMKTISEK